jgi:hypothetical protein
VWKVRNYSLSSGYTKKKRLKYEFFLSKNYTFLSAANSSIDLKHTLPGPQKNIKQSSKNAEHQQLMIIIIICEENEWDGNFVVGCNIILISFVSRQISAFLLETLKRFSTASLVSGNYTQNEMMVHTYHYQVMVESYSSDYHNSTHFQDDNSDD